MVHEWIMTSVGKGGGDDLVVKVYSNLYPLIKEVYVHALLITMFVKLVHQVRWYMQMGQNRHILTKKIAFQSSPQKPVNESHFSVMLDLEWFIQDGHHI